jgi:transcriptional regulator with XRE-family HTH domain
MINTLEFTKRLEKVMEYYGETASSFADKIGVQRSSISHILSGRNKPSLDFVLKVLAQFPEVELYWLLNGKGSFPKVPEPHFDDAATKDLISPKSNNFKTAPKERSKEIKRIVIFYADGTFEHFEHF